MRDLLVAYLLNAAWQIPLAAIGAPLVCRFAGLTPKARNRVWLGFLLAATLLPAFVFKAPAPPAVAVQAASDPARFALVETAPSPSLLSEEWQALQGMIAGLTAHAAPFLMALFALAALIVGVRLMIAGLAARRLLQRSRPATLADEITAALDVFAASHGRRAPPVRCSPDIRTPAVVGALRPVILIPERLAVGREALRAALLHEAAHVVRRDYAINLACEVLTLPVSWHPALIALKGGVRRSRELACDAMAASAMTSDQAYAKCLLALARALGANPPVRDAALLVGLFGRTDLEDRVMHLMNPARAVRGPLHAARLCGAGVLATGLLTTALVLHVSPAAAQQPVVSRTALPASAAAIPAAAVEAEPAEPAAPAEPAKPSPNHHRSVTISHRGVILNDDGGYERRWTSANGREITIFTRSDKDLTPDQKARLEASVAEAEKEGEAARALVESPEFKAKIAKAKEAGEAARKYTESAEFKAQIAKAREAGEAARKLTESPEFRAQIAAARAAGEAARASGDAARAAGEAARKMTESPEFKAQIAQARLSGEMARKMTESPEFKARMDAARQAGEAARQLTQSPEFKASVARARAAAERLQHEVDELDEQPSRATP
ncbi:M56 family metallopeptidase [Phenylobacterium sp.]|jgi:beta-lactamase regulating signal transducer with metallopeptidase domain|uniref:M56 family metallopeptidase n=1 Tax=Phenylobacterium sp. TaxID=1871053 RepID=UPI002E304BE7|nr:M56 family metallopeptidase [Phenylobacterium sp.]HEX3366152.1 M56 family metallopeptidase [Phenylobacterium sp.]